MKDTYTVWSNYNLDLDDWRDDLLEQCPDSSEDELLRMMYDTNNDYLDDERINLNIQLDQTIIIIADLGLWYGRRTGYKEIDSGNIRDCLYSDCDYVTWYVDKNGDFRCNACHHDGTNHYLYRVYKSNATDDQIEDLKEKLYNNTATEEDIESVTDRIGDKIAEVYGWEIN